MEFFCHKCRKDFLIEKSEGKIYVYSIFKFSNPGKKVVLEKGMSVKNHNPKRCPFCESKNIQKTKGGK